MIIDDYISDRFDVNVDFVKELLRNGTYYHLDKKIQPKYLYLDSKCYDAAMEFDTCAICLSSYVDTIDERLHETNCKHVFHHRCMQYYIERGVPTGESFYRCPLCRTSHQKLLLTSEEIAFLN